MPYRLRKHETVTEGCRRILFEQSASIVSALADWGGPLDDRIHDARKRIKRLRALLRLVQLKLEAKELAAHEDTLRDTAHKLAPARDAIVVLTTFEEMTEGCTDGTVKPVHDLLAAGSRKARRRSLGPDRLTALGGLIRSTCEKLGRAAAAEEGWNGVEAGLRRSYRVARRQWKTVLRDPTSPNLHRWRRLSKRLWEQLRLLRRALPKPIARHLRRLQNFTELLGRHHDFDLLQTALGEAVADGVEAAKFPPLQDRITAEMDRCFKRAVKYAEAIFALRTKDFVSRIHAEWKAWRKER
jgi:CHAD domain-containing protein